MRATVYLTDGFERLDLPGRECIFALEANWVARGQTCQWIWPHERNGAVAGAEVVMHGTKDGEVISVIEVDDLRGPPEVVEKGQEITFTPHMTITPNKIKEPT